MSPSLILSTPAALAAKGEHSGCNINALTLYPALKINVMSPSLILSTPAALAAKGKLLAIFLFLLITFLVVSTLQAQQDVGTNGTDCFVIKRPIRINYTITKGSMAPNTTRWIDEFNDAGVLVSTGQWWMQTNSAGTLAYNLPTAQSPAFGAYDPPIPGGPYTTATNSVAKSPKRILKTRDTVAGVASGTIIGVMPEYTAKYLTEPRPANFPGYGTDCTDKVHEAYVTYTGSGLPDCAWSLNAQIAKACPTDGVPHTIEVSDGITTYGPTTIPGDATEITGQWGSSAPSGTVVTLKLDGAVIESWTVGNCNGDPPAGNFFNHNSSTGSACEPTPTPTPTPTPEPSATPPIPTPTPGENYAPPNPTPPYQQPPSGGTNPPSNPPNPGTGSTPFPTSSSDGNVHVTNANEIYKPIVDAINGTDQAPVGAPEINSGFETGLQPSAITNDQTSTIQQSLDTGRAKHGEAVSSGTGKLESLQPLQLPSGISNKMSWSIALPKLGSFVIDISPYASIISIMRALLLMVLLIGVWFSTVKIIRSAIA
jgi:hypothetical protein